ncbi:hypothetical protein [Alicyclobacillus fodiniaquatilis]|uniref:Uncharacterized protein n=1 Tax=Alicyclobacillus fodiniaquatilis TaxID=1661150 RepID=A0ABW4JG70_9BACL
MRLSDDSLFMTLYNVATIIKEVRDVSTEEFESPYKGNLTGVSLRFPYECKGVKQLTVVLKALWDPSTGKGYFYDIDYQASAVIGVKRGLAINAALLKQFTPHGLEDNQPEGLYANYGHYEYCLMKRIKKVELVPLFTRQEERSKEITTVYRHESFIVESYEYAHDMIDESGSRYRIVRMITPHENEHGFLYTMPSHQNGHYVFVVFHDAKPEQTNCVEVIHDVVLASPPDVPLGTVFYDTEKSHFTKLIEVDGERHLLDESDFTKSTWEPFVPSSRFELRNDIEFECPTDGFYFDTKERAVYRAVAKRPNHLLLQMPDGSRFPHLPRDYDDFETGIISCDQLELVHVDYDVLNRAGVGYSNTHEGQILHDLLARIGAVEDVQEAFWIGLAVQYYGSLTRACHEFYFRLIDHVKYTGRGKDDITVFLLELLSPGKEQKSA